MKHLFILFSLISCANVLTSPDWVQSLRNGETSLKVKVGKRHYYRSILQDNRLSKNELCEAALEKNKEYIKAKFPKLKTIPMEIVLVHFDSTFRDCATTIAIDEDSLSKQAKKIKEENKKLKKQLNNLNVEIYIQEELNSKIKLARTKAEFLKTRKTELDYIFSELISVGMNVQQVTFLTKIPFEINGVGHYSLIGTNEICQEFGTLNASQHNNFVICWSNFEHPSMVLGVCDLLERNCFTNNF